MLPAQPVQFGVKGGVILTESTRYTHPESRNYTVGPTVEFRLPHRFGLETGFLYKRVGTGVEYSSGGSSYTLRSRGNSFELPLVGKYYFRPPSRLTPYLGLGVAMRRTWQKTEQLTPNRFYYSSVSPYGAGAVGAAGIRITQGRWKFAPEFRYTRWSIEAQAVPRNPNQVEFLFGISF